MKTEKLQVMLSKEENEAIDKLAKYYGISKSALARQVLFGKLSALQVKEA